MNPVHTTFGLRLSLAAQEIPRTHRVNTDGLLHETVEQLAPPSGGPTVKPERKLIQIGIQVCRTNGALMNATASA